MSIAFCFLTYDSVEHENIWNHFFDDIPKNKYQIITHPKVVTDRTPKWLKDHRVSDPVDYSMV